MRTLGATLLAEQKKASHKPTFHIEVANRHAGLEILDWEQLYDGSEEIGGIATIITEDGSLVRARCTGHPDFELYRQAVANPGPTSDFSQWTQVGSYTVVCRPVLCRNGSEISLFIPEREPTCAIYRITSTDNGHP